MPAACVPRRKLANDREQVPQEVPNVPATISHLVEKADQNNNATTQKRKVVLSESKETPPQRKQKSSLVTTEHVTIYPVTPEDIEKEKERLKASDYEVYINNMQVHNKLLLDGATYPHDDFANHLFPRKSHLSTCMYMVYDADGKKIHEQTYKKDKEVYLFKYGTTVVFHNGIIVTNSQDVPYVVHYVGGKNNQKVYTDVMFVKNMTYNADKSYDKDDGFCSGFFVRLNAVPGQCRSTDCDLTLESILCSVPFVPAEVMKKIIPTYVVPKALSQNLDYEGNIPDLMEFYYVRTNWIWRTNIGKWLFAKVFAPLQTHGTLVVLTLYASNNTAFYILRSLRSFRETPDFCPPKAGSTMINYIKSLLL